MKVFDSRVCELGEGPLWHPKQQRWYWFDILQSRLLAQDAQGQHVWQFNEMVSAAAWIDSERLLIASESQLFVWHSQTDSQQHLCDLEKHNPVTRSNDGRADPWGGFWIGTMGKNAEPGAGAIYRFYQGQLTKLYSQITISNAICFAHDKSCAYYTDTPSQQIMRQPLDNEGWPQGDAQVFIDLTNTDFNPDGAVVDAAGYLWNAQWGTSRVARYNPQGGFELALTCGAKQASCPAFGGADLDQLLVTTAAVEAQAEDLLAGQTFLTSNTDLGSIKGHAEYSVKV